MSNPNSSDNLAELESTAKIRVTIPQESLPNTASVFTSHHPVADVLICGGCSTQFSELKLFIDHKQSCGTTVSLPSATLSNVDPAAVQDVSHQPSQMATTQQIVLPSTATAGSIVSLPVGMPHVLLQSSSGMSQMFRIILEPSLNGATISSGSQLSPSSTTTILEPAHYEDESDATPIISKPDAASSEKSQQVNHIGSSTVEHTWVPGGTTDSRIFTSITTSDLHTEEEDVATFLATQLAASQSAPHHSKNRDSGNSSQLSAPQDDVKLAEHMALMDTTDKCNLSQQDDDEKFSHLEPQIKMQHICNIPQHEAQTQPTAASVLAEQLNRELKQYRRQKLSCEYENCSYQTYYQKDMARHVRKHTGEKPFGCTVCGSKFSRQDKLKVHMRIHKNERPYACKVPGCYYSGIEKAHLNKHMRTHTDERPYKCQMCPYAARDGSQLTVHLRSHTGDTPFHCQIEGCPTAFKTSSDLRRHERLHTGEKPFKCTECSYASALKSNLKVHFRINHYKTVKFGCRACCFSGTTKKQLREHEKMHPDLPPQDEKEGEPLFGQTLTRRTQGYTKPKVRSKPACIKNFHCQHCGSGFVRDDSYRSHMRQHQRHNASTEMQRELTQMNLLKFKNKTETFPNIVIQDNTMMKTNTAVEKSVCLESNNFVASSSAEPFPSSYVITIDGISSLYPHGVESITSSKVGTSDNIDITSTSNTITNPD